MPFSYCISYTNSSEFTNYRTKHQWYFSLVKPSYHFHHSFFQSYEEKYFFLYLTNVNRFHLKKIQIGTDSSVNTWNPACIVKVYIAKFHSDSLVNVHEWNWTCILIKTNNLLAFMFTNVISKPYISGFVPTLFMSASFHISDHILPTFLCKS